MTAGVTQTSGARARRVFYPLSHKVKNDAASPSLSQQLCHSFGTVAFMKQCMKLCLLWDAGSGLHDASVTVEKRKRLH